MRHFILAGLLLCSSLLADSFYEYKNGKRYFCQLDEEPGSGCSYIYNGVYCPSPGESCSYIYNGVHCGYSCSYIYDGVHCAGYGETCSYIYDGVYCGTDCKYIHNGVYCTSGGKSAPKAPDSPNGRPW